MQTFKKHGNLAIITKASMHAKHIYKLAKDINLLKFLENFQSYIIFVVVND
jgi:hypothetical protein